MEIRPIFSALLRNKTAPLLLAIQIAISLAVLANALFIVQLRIAASERPSGIDDESISAYFRVTPLDTLSYNEIMELQQRYIAALRAVPGVTSVAWTSQMPVSTSGSSGSVRASRSQTQETANPAIYSVQENFIPTLGLKLVEGRDFQPGEYMDFDDDKDGWKDNFPKSVIITRALGELLFPGATSFVGREFFFGLGEGSPVRVVGVIERLQTTQAQHGPAGEYSTLLPRRRSMASSRYAVRVEPGQREKVLIAGEEALRKASPRPTRVSARTTLEDRKNRYRNEKALAWMLISVSALLLLVTVSGIVGMTTLRVTQRRKQIGVRRALGARWLDILRYFITENIMITTGGIVAGLFLALGLNQLLISQLELSRLPFGYIAFGALALWLLGIASVWGPASRAANTPPAIATRTA